ncbi:hypothetical protein [Stenotrophomonas sp.]|uniref:hypothetical protein n=1 Tax=Stenotrophomonas sp. TaxID=69392 RepID=UPI00289B6F83|nr:hypothetical protein [Stenotrophomonas sp.]
MTQRHISHPEGLPRCAAGHSARHIHDHRGLAAGGGHFIECLCQQTRRYSEAETALSEWRRRNRALRGPRKVLPSIAAPADNVVQLAFGLAAAPPGQRAAGGGHGRR